MSKYCKVCGLLFDEEKCPKCGRKSECSAGPDDLCFLTEQEAVWSDMLADVLKQENIPFIPKKVLGAGLAIKTGPMRERVRFFVFFRDLPEATALLKALFSPSGEEGDENGGEVGEPAGR